MKFDPGIHIDMHSVLSLKPGVTTSLKYLSWKKLFTNIVSTQISQIFKKPLLVREFSKWLGKTEKWLSSFI